MQLRTAQRLATIAVITTVAVASLGGAALAADARTAKASVADAVEALAPTGDKRVDARINKAAGTVRSGLADKHWVDDATPATSATFRSDARAVRELNRVVKTDSSLTSDVRNLQRSLASIDHELAYERILAAAAAGADEDLLARAGRLVARGDLAASRDRFSRAIRAYARAWRIATRALDAVDSQAQANPAITVAANYSWGDGEWQTGDTTPADVVYDDLPIDFQYVVTNTGDVELTSVSLTDSVFASQVAASCSVPALAPGTSYSCIVVGQYLDGGNHTNTASVTAVGDGVTVTDSDSVHLTVWNTQGG